MEIINTKLHQISISIKETLLKNYNNNKNLRLVIQTHLRDLMKIIINCLHNFQFFNKINSNKGISHL